jgi:hypothetical protein
MLVLPDATREEEKKYKKTYKSGKYRTVVIVFEGKVIVAPYSRKGAEYNKGVTLTSGQTTTVESALEEASKKERQTPGAYGFDLTLVDKYHEKPYRRPYLAAKYGTRVISHRGTFEVAPYDENGPRREEMIYLNTGESVYVKKEVVLNE